MTKLTEQRVREIYEDFTFARFDKLHDVLDPRIDFLSHAPKEFFPYLGRRLGRAETLAALEETHAMVEVVNFWPLSIMIDHDDVALTVFIQMKDRKTNRLAQFVAAHFLTFRNGKIVRYCGIQDSYETVRQLSGKIQTDATS